MIKLSSSLSSYFNLIDIGESERSVMITPEMCRAEISTHKHLGKRIHLLFV